MKGIQNSYIEGQTTQWPKEKGQKDKQRSTKQTHKTKDRVPLFVMWMVHMGVIRNKVVIKI